MSKRLAPSDVRHRTHLSVTYETNEETHRVARSLRPEVGDIEDDRSQTTLSRTDETLTLTIEATDLVALRAGINTWLSLLAVAERVGAVEI